MVRNSKFRPRELFLMVLMLTGALGWVLWCWHITVAEVTPYSDSAHSQSDIGVYREFMKNLGYVRGNCAHCHEAHGSVGGAEPAPDQGNNYRQLYLQFADPGNQQNSGFCLACHTASVKSLQNQMDENYDYSRTRGGSTKSFPSSLEDAFYFIENFTAQPRNNHGHSNGSAHFLLDIVDEALKGNWGWPSLDNEQSKGKINACLGCHEPHRAKEDWPCSLGSGHADVYNWEVWGDDTGDEKMTSFSGYIYQPPYRVGKSAYEWVDATEAPNYVVLCLDCHSYPMRSTRYSRDLDDITTDWSHDVHLKGDMVGTDFGDKKPPYSDYASGINLVLMCTDCHEPHGSQNYMLLRTCVNGEDNITVTNYDDDEGVKAFCSACHDVTPEHTSWGSCLGPAGDHTDYWGCHNHDHFL